MTITRRQMIRNSCKRWGSMIGLVLGGLAALVALAQDGLPVGLIEAPLVLLLWWGAGIGLGWLLGWIVGNMSPAKGDAS